MNFLCSQNRKDMHTQYKNGKSHTSDSFGYFHSLQELLFFRLWLVNTKHAHLLFGLPVPKFNASRCWRCACRPVSSWKLEVMWTSVVNWTRLVAHLIPILYTGQNTPNIKLVSFQSPTLQAHFNVFWVGLHGQNIGNSEPNEQQNCHGDETEATIYSEATI